MLSKKIASLTVFALCALCMVASGVNAAEFGARAYGMGGAYTAVTDDVSALVNNPAGLAETSFELGVGVGSNNLEQALKFHEIVEDPSKFEGGEKLNLSAFGGVSINGFGAGMTAEGNISVDKDCGIADEPPPGRNIEKCAQGDLMKELIVGYGAGSSRMPLRVPGLSAGIALKVLDGKEVEWEKHEVLGQMYRTVTEKWHGRGYAADLGLKYKVVPLLTLGLNVDNVVSSLDWTGTWTETKHNLKAGKQVTSKTRDLGTRKETLKPTYRAGVAIHPRITGTTIAADYSSDGTIRYGAEQNLFFNALSLRVGQILKEHTMTTTAGVGVNLGPVNVDVAVGSSDGFETLGTTVVEGSLRF